MRDCVDLLDTWIDRIDLAGAVAQVDSFIRTGQPHQIVTVNVDFLRLSAQDAIFRDLINTADLVVPDGMPLLWAARLMGRPLPERVAGVELIDACAELAAQRGYGVFLLGAGPGVAAEAAHVLCGRHPGLRIVGTYAPPIGPFTPEEDDKMAHLIQATRPQMLFVAFGAPRQDQWIRRHALHLGVPVCMGVGGSLDILAGRVRRAPRWMQDHGLEWFFRITQDPVRLWRRYFVNDLPIFFQLMMHSRAQSAGFRPVAEHPVALAALDVRGGVPGDDAHPERTVPIAS